MERFHRVERTRLSRGVLDDFNIQSLDVIKEIELKNLPNSWRELVQWFFDFLHSQGYTGKATVA